MNKRVKVILILVLILAALAALFFAGRHFLWGRGDAQADADAVYVQPVAEIMGLSGGGMTNVFSGVVESPESWSVQKNEEYTVKEVFVKVGDAVKVGTPLFAYDTDQFNKDLSQGEIDLERLNNELTSLEKVLKQLEDARNKASGTERANFEIQIEEQNLEIKQKKIDITSKELEIEKLKKNVETAEVLCGMDGIVRAINDGTEMNYGQGTDNAFITVMQVDDLRVKGSINEQNIFNIQEEMPVLVQSRVDKEKTWEGKVSKIDTEDTQSGNTEMGGESGGSGSTNYSFYVSLTDSTGLILGQHVTIIPQTEDTDDGKLRLYEYYIDLTDESAPFVWAEEEGKLVKRIVTLGEYDEEQMAYVVESGLSLEDKIAFPEEGLAAGQATTDVFVMEMPEDEEMTGDMEMVVPEEAGAMEGAEEEMMAGEMEGMAEEPGVG